MAPTATAPQTAILYTRVSTDDQATSGLGLTDQADKLNALATLKDWTGIELVDDGASAKTLKRPAMTEALRMLKAGEANALVAVKLDRLTRSVADLATLMARSEREGWALVILDLGIDTSTASGKLVANVMASVAQWEREVIGERTSAALQVKKAEGARLGRKVTTPDEIRQRIAELRDSGLSWANVARQAAAEGLNRPSSGKPYGRSGCQKVYASVMLDREAAAAQAA